MRRARGRGMQVTVESPTALERKLMVQVPEERITGEVDKRLQDLAGSVRIPGFRPGKVPVKVVRQRFGRQVREEVVGEIVQTSLGDAISQEQLRPAGPPTIDPLEFSPGTGVTYTATFDVYPEISRPAVESLQIKRATAEVNETDIDNMLETLRQQRRTWEKVERAAASGDRVVVDFTGSVAGEQIDQGTGEAVPIELGAGRMIPGFEEGLEGIAASESRTLDLVFPENYPNADLAGSAVVFEIDAKAVEQPVLPELDEAFAVSLGVEEGGIEAFRVQVRGNMERELADGVNALTKQRVMEALLAGQSIDLPQTLVDQEAARALDRRRLELSHSGLDPDTLGLEVSMFSEAARRRVSLGLLLAEILKVQGIEVDPERVRERIETIASTYEDEEEVVNWYYSDRERLSDIESNVLEDQVVEWILETAQISDEITSFDEVLKPGQTTPQSSS